MLLPKDCIMITQDEAKTLLSLLGIEALSFPWETAQHAVMLHNTTGDMDKQTRTVYNLITAIKELEEAAYNRCYNCAAYDPED